MKLVKKGAIKKFCDMAKEDPEVTKVAGLVRALIDGSVNDPLMPVFVIVGGKAFHVSLSKLKSADGIVGLAIEPTDYEKFKEEQ